MLLLSLATALRLAGVLPAQTPEPPAVVRPGTIARFLETAADLPPNALVAVQGAVTLHHHGGALFIQDQTGAVFVHAQTNSTVMLGDVVEAIGTVNRDGYSPILQDSVYRSLGRRELVPPEPVQGSALQTGRYDMRLVRLQGHLVTAPAFRGEHLVLHLTSDHTIINLELSDLTERSALSQLRPGSRLQATGVCSVGGTSRRPTTVRLHLRSGDDVVVLGAPPWFTPARAALGVAAAGAAALVALGWVVTLRREVRRKTEQIAGRLRRENALEERYRRIVDTALEGILLLDAESQIQFLNSFMAEMLGYSTGELIGRPFTDLVQPASLAQARACLPPKPDTGQYGQVELSLLHRAGTDVWVLAAFTSYLDDLGAPEGTLAMVTNITARKVAEDRITHMNEALERRVEERTAALALANRELEAFSYSVSHDLRAPLRAIAGFSTALVEDYHEALPSEAQEYLRRIRNSAVQMSHLIDGLLSLGRVTRAELNREETDLSALVESVYEEIRQNNRLCPPAIQVEPGLVDRVDRNLIRIVFANLLQNACKFTMKVEQPLIEVGRQWPGTQPIYFVRDNGAGFDPVHVDKLFKVFQRLHPASEYEGSGIGLATVHRIVERHGGRIWAEGKVHGGASFYFTLQPEAGNNW